MVLIGQVLDAISNCRFLFSSELVGGAPRAASLKGKVQYFCQSLLVSKSETSIIQTLY